MTNLSAAAAEKVTALLNAATTNPTTDIPGVAFRLISLDGKPIYSHSSGLRSLSTPDIPMTTHSTFWLASLTKAITAVAALQLVEQGKLDLDSVEQCEELFPEGKQVKIITGFEEDGKPIMKEKKVGITLRMLLTHTGLFTYFLCFINTTASFPLQARLIYILPPSLIKHAMSLCDLELMRGEEVPQVKLTTFSRIHI